MCDRRHRVEKLDCFIDLHLQDFSDVSILPGDGQRFLIEACAVAHLAGDLDVRQERHLDCAQSLSGAGFAAAALVVEGEASHAVTSSLAFIRACKERADFVKEADVGGGTRSRRLADGGLIHFQNTRHRFAARDYVASLPLRLARIGAEIADQIFKKHFTGQSGLAGAGDARHDGQAVEREFHDSACQIVHAGIDHRQLRVCLGIEGTAGKMPVLARISQVFTRK